MNGDMVMSLKAARLGIVSVEIIAPNELQLSLPLPTLIDMHRTFQPYRRFSLWCDPVLQPTINSKSLLRLCQDERRTADDSPPMGVCVPLIRLNSAQDIRI